MDCLLGHSGQARQVDAIPAQELIDGWHKDFGIDITAELHGHDPVERYECAICGLRFFPPELAGSEALYAQLQRFEWYYMPRKWEHDMALAELHRGDRVLEVGCGYGDFVTRARGAGVEMEGIELSGSAVEEAQRRGLPVELLDLRDAADQRAGQYDVVCSFQVLEHVPNPREFLEQSCVLLKPGGRLIVGVPNAESFLQHQFTLLDMPPHHITRWSLRTMRALPSLLPLRLEQLRREPLADYHVRHYVEALWDRSPLWRFPPRFKVWTITALRRAGLRQRLTGQTLYASFTRV